MFNVFGFIFADSALQDLYDVYGTETGEIAYIYWGLFYSNIAYMVGYYIAGYWVINSKKVKGL